MSGPILCFGEALWDCLPAGLFMGGAPLNVAYHASQLGADARVVSAVGDDFLGHEIRRRLGDLRVDTRHLATVKAATGTVHVTLDQGKPSYTITDQVAWDYIPYDDGLQQAAEQAAALVFGSLAQRHQANRTSLAQLRAALNKQCLVAFDINLRAPYDDLAVIAELSQGVDLLKLNDEESALLLGQSYNDLADAARALRDRFQVTQVALTAGSKGAGLLDAHDHWHWAAARPITVADTVGAGDSFMAALMHGLLAQQDPAEVVNNASRLAEYVAGQSGPTPRHATQDQ